MASGRDFTIKYLNPVSRLFPTRLLVASSNHRIVLPFYHAVSDEALPHIDQLYRTKTEREFINELEFLLRYFTPVDFLQFKEIITTGSKLRKPVFLLSFDDGLKEFHEVIAPILITKGIPAICFLNSGFIDNRDLFFKYKASLLVSFLESNEKLYSDPALKNLARRNDIGSISRWLLSIDYTQASKLDQAASIIGYDFQNFLRSVQPYLTTDQIQKLIRNGFYFGAHSIDHPDYRFLSMEEQLRQTRESIDQVTHKFKLDYRLFAFPFTDYRVSREFFTTVFEKKIVDFTFGGAGLKKDTHPFHFQRISFERRKLAAKEIYKTELLYSALLNLLGRNRIERS